MQNMRLIKNLLTLADSISEHPARSKLVEEAADTILNLEIELAAMRGAANSFKLAYNNLLMANGGKSCECRVRKAGNQDSSTIRAKN